MDNELQEISEKAFELKHIAKIVHTLIESASNDCDDPTYILPASELLQSKSDELFSIIDDYEMKTYTAN